MTSLDSIAEKIHAARGARTHNLWMILTPSARNHSATAAWELGCPALPRADRCAVSAPVA